MNSHFTTHTLPIHEHAKSSISSPLINQPFSVATSDKIAANLTLTWPTNTFLRLLGIQTKWTYANPTERSPVDDRFFVDFSC